MHSRGLNLDCKLRRESTDLEDTFIAQIAVTGTLASALCSLKVIHLFIPERFRELAAIVFLFV